MYVEPKEMNPARNNIHREKQIAHYVAEGYSTEEIAVALRLSVQTVREHRKNIVARLAKIQNISNN